MKYTTAKYSGQQSYDLPQYMLDIVTVRVNGKKVNAEFFMKLPGVPRKDGEIMIEIVRATTEVLEEV